VHTTCLINFLDLLSSSDTSRPWTTEPAAIRIWRRLRLTTSRLRNPLRCLRCCGADQPCLPDFPSCPVPRQPWTGGVLESDNDDRHDALSSLDVSSDGDSLSDVEPDDPVYAPSGGVHTMTAAPSTCTQSSPFFCT